MKKIKDFLSYTFNFGEDLHISVQTLLIVILAIFISSYLLRIARRLITRKLPEADKAKFVTVFGYLKWLIYLVIFLITMQSAGVNVTAIFAASAALLIGIGLALQTFFQDIISGIFILIDQSVKAGDIIELDGKTGRVEEIKLRTTRAVTIDNKVLVIPNHLYLTNCLYNWTENGTETRESVAIGIAYGSDVQLVKSLLLKAANSNSKVIAPKETTVFFTNFGDSSLDFKVVFTLNNSFEAAITKSDIRFEIDKLFREHHISIPFPQRDVHLFQQKEI